MLILFLVTVALAALRVLGDSSTAYKLVSLSWFGGLVGYSVGVQNWVVILSAVLLAVAEGYMGFMQFIPSISLVGLFKRFFK